MEFIGNEEINSDINYYAVYILNQDKYLSIPRNNSLHGANLTCDNSASQSKSSDSEESSGCLSLLEANIEAEQETIVRCHLLKNLSVIENAGFENEGKCVTLKYSSETKQPFGCYYHHLRKDFHSDSSDSNPTENTFSRKVSFFICLISNDDKGMESFCSELGAFCCSFLHYLDPEGHQCQKGLLVKLQHWHFYCVKYISRCIEKFKESLIVLFQAALWGKIEIDCEDERLKADLMRFSDACSLNTLLLSNLPDASISESVLSIDSNKDVSPGTISLKVVDEKITSQSRLSHYTYCKKWFDRLMSCSSSDHILLKNVLEAFHLKIVQDLNLLKRLLKKAENDYYSLYRAYQFLTNSGYENALIHHVQREAHLSSNEEALRIIKCLDDFIKDKKQEQKQ